MKKVIYLSIAVVATLQSEEILEDISVVEEGTTQVVKNISGEEIKSADLAEALNRNVPSISIIRRSGIANDIILRGQKRDNINVTIDGTKVCGACVNRMDPPTSHVVTHAIEDVEVQEGPFDIEEFGALSGSIKIRTKKPTKDFHGDIALNGGSFGYKKASGTLSGGTDRVRLLFTTSTESGEQYEDGDGNNFAQQLRNYTSSTPSPKDDPFIYSHANQNRDAFEKQMYMGKMFIDVTPNQELQLSYTANRSDNVLYPSSKMDALYDDSDIFNLQYALKNLGSYSKKLEIQAYNSKVDHPMSTKYREVGEESYMTHALTTDMKGLKIKNSLDAFGQTISYGLDSSRRNWDGAYSKVDVASGKEKMIRKSIDDVDTENIGLFLKSKKSIGAVELEMGARYDDTSITTASKENRDNDYSSFSANIFANYRPNDETKYFAGVGSSNRVPDARELYNTKTDGKLNGNPDLEATTNYELDVGVEKEFDQGGLKVKTFYSKLKNYIYYNGSLANSNFENIDASIYGAEVSGYIMPTENSYLSAGLAYKRGKKDTQTTGQTNTNLAEITPLKLNLTAEYDYDESGTVEASLVATDRWDKVDSENGEQELAGYGVVNLKTTREFENGLELTLGVDNLLDKTYTTTNTYKDLILMTDGTDTMLINEPGRYLYLNAKYQF